MCYCYYHYYYYYYYYHHLSVITKETWTMYKPTYGHRAKCWYSCAPVREVYCRQHLFSSWVSIQPIWLRISFVSWPRLFIGREYKFWFNLNTDFTNNRHMNGVSLASNLSSNQPNLTWVYVLSLILFEILFHSLLLSIISIWRCPTRKLLLLWTPYTNELNIF